MTSRPHLVLATFLLSLTFFRLPGLRARAAPEHLYIVAAQSFRGNDLSFATVRDCFRGEGVDAHGSRLIPINQAVGSGLRVQFDRAVLGLDPAAAGRFWIDRRIRGEGRPPIAASSPELSMRIVASLVGSITYATKSMLTPQVKVLAVDGKLPESSGYALP